MTRKIGSSTQSRMAGSSTIFPSSTTDSRDSIAADDNEEEERTGLARREEERACANECAGSVKAPASSVYSIDAVRLVVCSDDVGVVPPASLRPRRLAQLLETRRRLRASEDHAAIHTRANESVREKRTYACGGRLVVRWPRRCRLAGGPRRASARPRSSRISVSTERARGRSPRRTQAASGS
jgi:hypothetical protein